jgi:hypothetical protein
VEALTNGANAYFKSVNNRGGALPGVCIACRLRLCPAADARSAPTVVPRLVAASV